MAVSLDKENVITALCCISGLNNRSGVTPSIIKEAENALLSWENSNPTAYAVHLLEILVSPQSQSQSQSQSPSPSPSPQVEVPRLAAVLTMKAMVGRKWKDRGRLSKKTKLILLDNNTKNQIRNVLLSVLTAGGVAGNYILDRNLSLSLIRDKTLMVSESTKNKYTSTKHKYKYYLDHQASNTLYMHCSLGTHHIMHYFWWW